jgi:hypothetical protein
MREQHPTLDRDVPPDAVLWRYMAFPKFVSMLKERALYFCRADLLGDPLEGSFTRAREVERQALLQNPPDGRTRDELAEVFRHNQEINMRNSRMIYVNCWHLGDHESMALWQGYGSGEYCVASAPHSDCSTSCFPRSSAERVSLLLVRLQVPMNRRRTRIRYY